MLKYSFAILILILAAAIYSCKDPVSGEIENLPPNTNLSLFPDSIIAPGTTVKTIRWWGDDPDGIVAGFRISFDSVNWGYTTKNDSTFILHINGNDSTFRFWVAAVDNKGLTDPTPATNLYPVINSPPNVVFDPVSVMPDTTYPVATFKWVGSDPDGIANIRYYHWALNDTSNFRRMPATSSLLTLTKDSGLAINSDNIFYLRAEDDAGALSPIIRMPDTSGHWYVRDVTARVLLIKDMPISEFNAANSFFNIAMDTVRYNVLDIKSNGGNLIPKIINPMFVETMKLFDVVIWSANRGNLSSDNASFELAQNSIPFYLQSGKKLFFTTGYPNAETQVQGSLINFAPIDSISSCTISLVNANTNLINSDTSYPVLKNGSLFIQRVRGIKSTRPPAEIMYRLPINTSCQDSTVVAIKDVGNNPRQILMILPVYFLSGDMTAAKSFFRKMFQDFGLN